MNATLRIVRWLAAWSQSYSGHQHLPTVCGGSSGHSANLKICSYLPRSMGRSYCWASQRCCWLCWTFLLNVWCLVGSAACRLRAVCPIKSVFRVALCQQRSRHRLIQEPSGCSRAGEIPPLFSLVSFVFPLVNVESNRLSLASSYRVLCFVDLCAFHIYLDDSLGRLNLSPITQLYISWIELSRLAFRRIWRWG